MRLSNHLIDFSDTATAFSHLTDAELRKAVWLFGMMGRSWLVKFGSRFGLWAVNNNLPFAKTVFKNTVFEQFVGGTTLLETQKSIDRLWAFKTKTVLDYGAEAKETETDFNYTMNENLRAIDFASRSGNIPVVSVKLTGLSRFGLLEKLQSGAEMTPEEKTEFKNVFKRIDAICHHANSKNVSVFIDAEESWIQDAIDFVVWRMMRRYNTQRAVVYNTYQMYRQDRLQFLVDSFDKAQEGGFILGAKLVRGAYMEKERIRAEELGLPNPIHPTKMATDDCFNMGIRFCIEHHDRIASCNASHNTESALLQIEQMEKKGIPKDHPHMSFCQLYGMSDNMTFNLAAAGYNSAKYVVYGHVEDVAPYLIRRAQENTSVTGDVGRELGLLKKEMKRRGLA